MPQTTQRLITAAKLLAPILLIGTLGGCDKEGPEPLQEPPHIQRTAPLNTGNPIWQLASHDLDLCISEAQTLQQQIAQLLAQPSDTTLDAAREQWHKSHNSAQRLTPYFTLGKINPGLFGNLAQDHFRLEAWPIQPGYLDYFGDYRYSGLTNDITIQLTSDTLRQQHGLTDKGEIAIGLHPVAYLLWGVDEARPFEDFGKTTELSPKQAANGFKIDELSNNRRRKLITLQAQMLVEDLQAMKSSMLQRASDIVSVYGNLKVSERSHLWRQAILFILERDLLQQQIPPLLATQSAAEKHNEYAGHSAMTAYYNVSTIETLLWFTTQESPYPLVDRLLPDTEQQATLRGHLKRAQQQLTELDQQGTPPSEKKLEHLQQTLQAASKLLTL